MSNKIDPLSSSLELSETRSEVELECARLARLDTFREALARGVDDAADGGAADAAARGLYGAAEGLRVARVGQQREVGERVADLGALVCPPINCVS